MLPPSAPRANSTCQIKKVAGLHNTLTLPSPLRKGLKCKGGRTKNREKKKTKKEGEFISLQHDPAEDTDYVADVKYHNNDDLCRLDLA